MIRLWVIGVITVVTVAMLMIASHGYLETERQGRVFGRQQDEMLAAKCAVSDPQRRCRGFLQGDK